MCHRYPVVPSVSVKAIRMNQCRVTQHHPIMGILAMGSYKNSLLMCWWPSPKMGNYVKICTIQLLTRSMWIFSLTNCPRVAGPTFDHGTNMTYHTIQISRPGKLPGNLGLTLFPQPRNLPKLPRQQLKGELNSQQYRCLKMRYTHVYRIPIKYSLLCEIQWLNMFFLHHPIWGYHIFGSQNGVLVRCHPSYWPCIPRFMPKRSVWVSK